MSKISRRFTFLVFVLLAGAAQAQDPYTVLFLGDSLTAGYGLDDGESFPAMVEDKLAADGYDHVEVINGGISGSTTASALSRLQWFIRSQPDLMVLSLGANDGLRGLDVDLMRENLSKTIEFARDNGVEVALTGMLIPPNYGPEYTSAFAAVFPELAQRYELPFLPFLLEDVAAKPELNQADGVHPNLEGTKLVAQLVYDFIRPLLPAP